MKLSAILIIFLVFIVNVPAQINSSATGENILPDTLFQTNESFLFSREASYVGDFVNNMNGGIKRGTVYLGMVNIRLGINTEAAGLWKGGELFINGAATHGGTPSGELIGDFQIASNIEAGNHTYLHEFWYKHSMANVEITIGLQDLNADFVTSEFAGNFINSSFGIPSLISDNVPVPIFPLTALGIAGKFNFTEKIALLAGVFDGLPENFENNKYNLNWELKENDGIIIFSEIHLTTNFNKLAGTLKAGSYYHTHLIEKTSDGIDETIFHNNYGFYLIADQIIFQNERNSLGLFVQVAASPANKNQHNYYFGGGINYSGLFSDSDLAGLAIANALFNENTINNETTIELFYKVNISDYFFLQPDLQYIINPAGLGKSLPNALTGIIRFGINF